MVSDDEAVRSIGKVREVFGWDQGQALECLGSPYLTEIGVDQEVYHFAVNTLMGKTGISHPDVSEWKGCEISVEIQVLRWFRCGPLPPAQSCMSSWREWRIPGWRRRGKDVYPSGKL